MCDRDCMWSISPKYLLFDPLRKKCAGVKYQESCWKEQAHNYEAPCPCKLPTPLDVFSRTFFSLIPGSLLNLSFILRNYV